MKRILLTSMILFGLLPGLAPAQSPPGPGGVCSAYDAHGCSCYVFLGPSDIEPYEWCQRYHATWDSESQTCTGISNPSAGNYYCLHDNSCPMCDTTPPERLTR